MSVNSILLMKRSVAMEVDMVGSMYWRDWDRDEWPEFQQVGV